MVVIYIDKACGKSYNYKNNISEISLNSLNRSASNRIVHIHDCYGSAKFTLVNTDLVDWEELSPKSINKFIYSDYERYKPEENKKLY